MKRQIVVIALSVVAVLLAGANWAVGRAASHSVPRQTIDAINSAPPVIDVFGMGSSLVAAGFDAATIGDTFRSAGHKIEALNGALGATGVTEHLALTRLALRHHVVRTLVYGFGDQQMSSGAPLRNSDLIGNRAMLYYQEPDVALQYGGFDFLDLVEFQTYRCCALLRERSNIWAKVEKMRRAMQDVGMPHQETNQFGRKADFDLLEAANSSDFERRCQVVMRSGNFLAPALRELFREAKVAGSRILVVEMPMSPAHVARFYSEPIWKEYRLKTRSVVERSGGIYVDASTWIPEEEDFQDHIHLSRSGAARFSRLLAQELLQQGLF